MKGGRELGEGRKKKEKKKEGEKKGKKEGENVFPLELSRKCSDKKNKIKTPLFEGD